MGGATTNTINLRQLLEDTALHIFLPSPDGGEDQEYIVTDIPLKAVLEAHLEQQEGRQSGDKGFLLRTLVPCGVPAEAIEALGVRATTALALKVSDFFVPLDLIEKMQINPAMRTVFRTGLGPLLNSLPNTPATESSTSSGDGG